MTTLYRNGRIFDGERMIDGHAVLVEAGRISRVAAGRRVRGLSPTKRSIARKVL